MSKTDARGDEEQRGTKGQSVCPTAPAQAPRTRGCRERRELGAFPNTRATEAPDNNEAMEAFAPGAINAHECARRRPQARVISQRGDVLADTQ